jgi:CheY-like chemotaxis protein
MDGFSLARAIRDGDPQGAIRIVAMSGYGEEQVAHRMQPGLIDRWLLKPIAPDVLLEVIENS